ncbi:hypothetical protein JCM9140_1908 [Halalkalibacter wakoensis JCM 9140]|uniref:Uncharacterized protein n=1 Tax=Halalkalibacter wakoensis JCM 9140 TaxID=1236970 RepID=W4Q1P1_9BACI|nr:hypothetical protein [Halalkalibacter wakoensis]GAE25887.1 hypothetical protein JCM9140_1908 [Halalkalibacter wakoensis JCM 9140]
MEALILLLISVCLLSLYGLVYVSIRLVGDVKSNEKNEFKQSLFYMITFLLISGLSVAFLLLY